MRFHANQGTLAYVGSVPAAAKRDGDSWFTPPRYVEKVRAALGGSIDFDPFSSAAANQIVKATRFYTIEDNAIRTPWPFCETVFMNPPYSDGICDKACQAFAENFNRGTFRRGIVLVNNATDTAWWSSLTDHASCVAICFSYGRIGFWNTDRKAISGNTRGQAFVLFASADSKDAELELFKEQFDDVGRVWLPSTPSCRNKQRAFDI